MNQIKDYNLLYFQRKLLLCGWVEYTVDLIHTQASYKWCNIVACKILQCTLHSELVWGIGWKSCGTEYTTLTYTNSTRKGRAPQAIGKRIANLSFLDHCLHPAVFSSARRSFSEMNWILQIGLQRDRSSHHRTISVDTGIGRRANACLQHRAELHQSQTVVKLVRLQKQLYWLDLPSLCWEQLRLYGLDCDLQGCQPDIFETLISLYIVEWDRKLASECCKI